MIPWKLLKCEKLAKAESTQSRHAANNVRPWRVSMFDVRRLMCLVGTALLVAAFQVPAADTLKVGISVSLTGPAAEVGRNTLNGAQLATDEINKAGGVLGRQIELVVEDDKTTNPVAVLAFSKLSGNAEIPAFLGPSRSTQIHAIAPDVMKISKPIMIDGTDPTLTHMGNPWLFRCRPNDTYSAKVMADFGVDTLGKRKWAIV